MAHLLYFELLEVNTGQSLTVHHADFWDFWVTLVCVSKTFSTSLATSLCQLTTIIMSQRYCETVATNLNFFKVDVSWRLSQQMGAVSDPMLWQRKVGSTLETDRYREMISVLDVKRACEDLQKLPIPAGMWTACQPVKRLGNDTVHTPMKVLHLSWKWCHHACHSFVLYDHLDVSAMELHGQQNLHYHFTEHAPHWIHQKENNTVTT